jgi:hypothetical protein
VSDVFTAVKNIPTSDIFRAFYPSFAIRKEGSIERAVCPFHPDGRTPNLAIYQIKFHCYACGAHGTNIDLLLKGDLALDAKEAAEKIALQFGIKCKTKGMEKRKPLTVEEYAEYVRLPVEFLVKAFHLENGDNGILFPYLDANGDLTGTRIRHTLSKTEGKDTRFSWRKGSRLFLYGAWAICALKEQRRVILVEGESDTQVLWFNNIPALGVPGANLFKREWAPCS